jgi:alpha-tubulin suppressor-like RCC1 family protein
MLLTHDENEKYWLYGIGSNQFGQLGSGKEDTGFSTVPIITGGEVSVFQTVIQVVTGSKHTTILLNNRAIYCLGSNEFGQLGVSDNYTV